MKTLLFLFLFLLPTVLRYFKRKKSLQTRANDYYTQGAGEDLQPRNREETDKVKSARKFLKEMAWWNKHGKKFGQETSEKRRHKMIALFNEALSDFKLGKGTDAAFWELGKRLDKIKQNPGKYLRVVILMLYSSASVMAQDAAGLFDKAEALYKDKNYTDALAIYQKISITDPEFKPATVYYKTGLAYAKLKDCPSAVEMYTVAYAKDVGNGGASSLAKFEEKVEECGSNLSALKSGNTSAVVTSSGYNEVAKQYTEEGNALYKSKDYQAALTKYRAGYEKSEGKQQGILAYKIAICLQKLDKCDEAQPYFKDAYIANPDNGGASTPGKFEEALEKCGFTFSDIGATSEAGTGTALDYQKMHSALMDSANMLYKAGDYRAAQSLFEAIALNIPDDEKKAAAYYKAALCGIKLDDCANAFSYFKSAYAYNPSTGGASSMEKFLEKSRTCGYEPEATDSKQKETGTTALLIGGSLLSLFLGWIASFITIGIYSKLRKKKLFDIQKIRLDIDTFAHNEELWNSEIKPIIGMEEGEKLRKLFGEILTGLSSAAYKNHEDFGDLMMLKNAISTNPKAFAGEHPQHDMRSHFLRLLKAEKFCFFTGMLLDPGRSYVISISHQGQAFSPVPVWVSSKIYKTVLESKPLKVRLHPLNGEYVHWSFDASFHDMYASLEVNLKLRDAWQGEAKNVSLDKYYPITKLHTGYLYPAPDSIVQANVVMNGIFREEKKTGFDNNNMEPGQSGTGPSFLDGVLIGSLLDNDHSASRFDNEDVS